MKFENSFSFQSFIFFNIYIEVCWVSLAEDEPLPLEVEPRLLNMSILRKFPCVGTVLRVKAHVDISMHIQEMGQWVKIRNMTYEIHSGLWLGRLLPTTKLTFLLDNEHTVLECKR